VPPSMFFVPILLGIIIIVPIFIIVAAVVFIASRARAPQLPPTRVRVVSKRTENLNPSGASPLLRHYVTFEFLAGTTTEYHLPAADFARVEPNTYGKLRVNGNKFVSFEVEN